MCSSLLLEFIYQASCRPTKEIKFFVCAMTETLKNVHNRFAIIADRNMHALGHSSRL